MGAAPADQKIGSEAFLALLTVMSGCKLYEGVGVGGTLRPYVNIQIFVSAVFRVLAFVGLQDERDVPIPSCGPAVPHT